MSPTTLPRLLLAASLATLLGGCSILGSGDKNPVTLYSPAVQVKVDPSWPQADWQLVLAKPSAARMVDSPRITVRPTPSELEIYKGASWAQPATDMIEDALLRAAYRFCHYNQVHTAALLGLSRNVTRTRLIKIGELAVNKRRLTENLRGERLIQLSI